MAAKKQRKTLLAPSSDAELAPLKVRARHCEQLAAHPASRLAYAKRRRSHTSTQLKDRAFEGACNSLGLGSVDEVLADLVFPRAREVSGWLASALRCTDTPRTAHITPATTNRPTSCSQQTAPSLSCCEA